MEGSSLALWGRRASLTQPCPGSDFALGMQFQEAEWKFVSVTEICMVEWRRALLGSGKKPTRLEPALGPSSQGVLQTPLLEAALGGSAVQHLPLITFFLLIRSVSTADAQPAEGSSASTRAEQPLQRMQPQQLSPFTPTALSSQPRPSSLRACCLAATN